MFAMKKVLLIISILGCCHSAKAQLVNIESKRMQTDSIRFALKTDLLFNYSNNNGDYLFQVGSNTATQYKSKDLKKIYFFISNYNLVRSKDQDYQNAWFFHFRYNQKMTKLLRLEAFVQNQSNTLLTISSRKLVGAGIRLKFISTPATKAYFGNAYMYEIEKIEATNQHFYNHRSSSYLSLSHTVGQPKLDFTGSLYFQPLYRDIGNHRILAQLKTELPISKVLSISALYNYFYSSYNAAGDTDASSAAQLGLTLDL